MNLLFSSVWRMNRSAKGLFIKATTLDGLVWPFADNSLNFSTIRYIIDPVPSPLRHIGMYLDISYLRRK